MKTYRAKITIPSSSHNSHYTEELGQHWPTGQLFKELTPGRKKYHEKIYGASKIVLQQVGGEEVRVMIDAKEFDKYLEPTDDTPAPRIEHTAAGAQVVINDTPTRKIPAAPLRPRRPQNDAPLELERTVIEAAQGKLF